MTTVLTIIEGHLQNRGIQYYRLDGNTKRSDRDSSIRLFQKSKTNSKCCQIFLLSTRAGGVGINLQQADTVVLFDSDWNPQVDLQAISRLVSFLIL
jgi:SNF2 family DNA or RNA helicase